MALEDMIARSGGANFETMRKGWLPSPEEKASRRMAELQTERQQQLIDAEPQRRRLADLQLKTAESEFEYLPTKRKRETRKEQTAIKQADQVTELFDAKMKKYNTEEEILIEERNHSITSKIITGAFNRFQETDDIYEAKKIIRQNYKATIDAGDDGTDAAVDRFLSSTITEDEAISMLSNLNSVLPGYQEAINKRRLAISRRAGGTQLERFLEDSDMSEDEKDLVRQSAIDKSSGETSKRKFKTKVAEKKEKALIKARETATGAMKRVTERNDTIDEAIQSMDSGNNALSDKLLTSKLLNLSDTNVRAFAIYKELDSSFGNLLERAVDVVGQVAWGKRTERQNEIIRETLTKMKALSIPVMERLRQQNRALAKADGHDPFRVVPPVSAIDIADSKLIDRKAKEKLFEQYPQFMDEILNEAK